MAAAPTPARMAVMKMVKHSTGPNTIPYAWQMNMTATPSYNAVPSMLTVAPRGRTKSVVCSDAPVFSTTFFLVRGRVAAEDAVENAMTSASLTWLIYKNGFFFVTR